MKTKLCYKEFTSSNGFEELIEEVNKVSVTVDVSDIKEETTVMATVKAYDSYGAVVESDRMIYNRDTEEIELFGNVKTFKPENK